MNVIETLILVSTILAFMWLWVSIFDLSAFFGAIVALPASFVILAVAGPVAAIAGIAIALYACYWILTEYGPYGILVIAGLVGAVAGVVMFGFAIIGIALLIVAAIIGGGIARYAFA